MAFPVFGNGSSVVIASPPPRWSITFVCPGMYARFATSLPTYFGSTFTSQPLVQSGVASAFAMPLLPKPLRYSFAYTSPFSRLVSSCVPLGCVTTCVAAGSRLTLPPTPLAIAVTFSST
ncbi:hypothetical protein [Granulicella paludicola]|uniref:hypothetical protein n=1 Tax=Granulicella paludicola TaxID=474951 RepID=UPI0021E04C10|nr:hypothetical protein [Granulicella paludicola]